MFPSPAPMLHSSSAAKFPPVDERVKQERFRIVSHLPDHLFCQRQHIRFKAAGNFPGRFCCIQSFHNLILSIKTGRTLLWIRPSMSLLFSIFLYFSGKLAISLISSGRCSRFSFLFHKITCLILSSVSETSLLRIASTT